MKFVQVKSLPVKNVPRNCLFGPETYTNLSLGEVIVSVMGRPLASGNDHGEDANGVPPLMDAIFSVIR